MYLIEHPQYPDKVVKDFIHLPDTTEDAATLTAIIEALQRFTKPSKLRIFTKCNGVFFAIDTGRIQSSKMDGFKNAKGQPTRNAELWHIFLSLISKHSYTITQEDHSFRDYIRSELKKCQ